MKTNIFNKVLGLGMMLALFASCENSDIKHPDYEGGTTVYFPYQYPVRTIVLGDGEDYDLTNDHNHVCELQATFGGAYDGKNGSVNFEVDNNLLNKLTFADGSAIKAMPANYYTLASNTFNFNGSLRASVKVQLQDEFFNDPAATSLTYVIPVKMTSQSGFGKILEGSTSAEVLPDLTDDVLWDVRPKNYMLYAVKFINKYTGFWVADGEDVLTDAAGASKTNARHYATVEKRVPVQLTTKSLNTCVLNVSYAIGEKTYDAQLLLTFGESGAISVSSLTSGVTATGSGQWTSKGATKENGLWWNQKERDMIDINYAVTFADGAKASTKDNLVYQRSGVVTEEYVPVYVR